MRTQDKESEIAFYNTYSEALTDPFPSQIYHQWFKAGGIPGSGAGKVLDAGTGAGHFGWRLAEAGYEVTGVDLSPKMAQRANRNAPSNFKAIAGDLEDPKLFPAASFDGIIFGQVLHHFPNPVKVLTHCALWIKPQGWLVIVEPNGANPVNRLGKTIGSILRRSPRFEQSMGTVNEVHVTPWVLQNRLKKAGFCIASVALLGDLGIAEDDLSQVPFVLRTMVQLREKMYLWAWRFLPKPLGCTTVVAKAQRKNGASCAS